MTLDTRVELTGLLRPGAFQAWKKDREQRIRAGALAALRASGPPLREIARRHVRQTLKIRDQRALNTIRYKVFNEKPGRLPALDVGATSLAKFINAHENGATIRGRGRGLLIPINYGARRPSAKRFKATVRALMRQGNAWFDVVRGRVLLFAQNIKESGSQLAPFKRGLRGGLGGGRLKRSAYIPIAVFVPQVKLEARLKVRDTLRRQAWRIAREVERRIKL